MRKRLAFLGSLLLSIGLAAVAIAAGPRPLPAGVEVRLNARYPGWKLVQVSPQHEESRAKILVFADEQIRLGKAKPEDFEGYEKLKNDDLQPSNRIFGDFNGDGAEDCAVLIKRPSPALLNVIVYLATGGTYQEVIVESVPIAPDFTLMLVKKGEAIGDEPVGPATDYIRVDSPEASAHWFVFKDGKFERRDVASLEAPQLDFAPGDPSKKKELDSNSIKFHPEVDTSTPTPTPPTP